MMIDSSRLRRAFRLATIHLLCATILAIPIGLAAQEPNTNKQALDLAQKLGRERSAEGLDTIIGAHNVDLIAAYARGFEETSVRIYHENQNKPGRLPGDIEALIVKNYQDPQVGGALKVLCRSNVTRYQTRALFDLMLTEWRSEKPRPFNYQIRDSIFKTDAAGVEAPLLEWLQSRDRPSGEDGNAIVRFLAERKYRPAVPVLIALQKNAWPDSSKTVGMALLDFGTAEAISAVVQRLAALRAQPATPEAGSEVTFLTSRFAAIPAEVPLDFAAYRKALPAVLSDEVKGNLLTLIARRKEKQGVPDVLLLLAETKFYPRALETLIAFDSPEIWKQTRAEVESLKQRGALNDSQYRFASSLLDAKIANPERHFADKKQAERQKEFDAKRSPLYVTRNSLQKLKDTQPEQYVTGFLDFLKSEERLAQDYADLPTAAGMRTEMSNDYLNLGHLLRFKLRQTARAFELYASSRRLGNEMAAFAVADAYQFDMRDKAKALAEYQRMLEQVQRAPASVNDMEAGLANWMKSWLTHQIKYLKTGQTFSGAVGQDDVAGAGLLLYFGAGAAMQDDYLGLALLYRPLMGEPAMGKSGTPQFDRSKIGKSLDALPPSGLTLLRSASLVTLMPDANAILRYLDRHDPAGYASACLFALVDMVDRQAGAARETAILLPGLALPPPGAANPMRAAAARFFKERKISLNTRPDPRMSSPEKTWKLLIASLKSGDLDTAFACMTPGLQARFRPAFTQSPPDELRAMAESFSGFSISANIGGDIQEAVVVRGKQAGMIYFMKVGGAWKINEM
jgi:hypothetical protein